MVELRPLLEEEREGFIRRNHIVSDEKGKV